MGSRLARYHPDFRLFERAVYPVADSIRASAMSRDPSNAGAIAFKRSGDPLLGDFTDAIVIKAFGEVPEKLDEL